MLKSGGSAARALTEVIKMDKHLALEFARSCSLDELNRIIDALEGSDESTVNTLIDWLSEETAKKYNEVNP